MPAGDMCPWPSGSFPTRTRVVLYLPTYDVCERGYHWTIINYMTKWKKYNKILSRRERSRFPLVDDDRIMLLHIVLYM